MIKKILCFFALHDWSKYEKTGKKTWITGLCVQYESEILERTCFECGMASQMVAYPKQ